MNDEDHEEENDPSDECPGATGEALAVQNDTDHQGSEDLG